MSGFIDEITIARLYSTDYGRAVNISYSAERKYIYIHTNIDVVDVYCFAYDSNNQNVDQIHLTNNYARIDISSYYRVLITEENRYNTSDTYTKIGTSGTMYNSFYDDFITDREYGDVQRVIEFEKCGWANLEDDEKEEWYAGMKGSLNYSDLNRIQDGALRILEQYYKDAEYTQLSYNAFTPSTSYVVVILKNGLSGTITKTSDSTTTSVNYGINIVSVSSGSNYTTSFSTSRKEDVCIFEANTQIVSNLAMTLFVKNQMLNQSELLPTLQIANLVGNYINRPALVNSDDYRSVGSNGSTSTSMTGIDYNRINEYEKSLKLSFDWIHNGQITIPYDWEIERVYQGLEQEYLSSKYKLKNINETTFIGICVPNGYIVKVVEEFGSTIFSHMYISDGSKIEYGGSATPYKYSFEIYGDVYGDTINTQVGTEKEVYCEFANIMAIVKTDGESSAVSLQGYDENNNIVQEWTTYSYTDQINVSEFHHVDIIAIGQSGSVELKIIMKIDGAPSISDLDTDLIEISVAKN